MEEIWSEQFRIDGLPHPDLWRFETEGNAYGWELNQLQLHTENRELNCEIRDRILNLRAVREDHQHFSYTSARLASVPTIKYGTIRVRAKLPKIRGLWSCISLKTKESRYVEGAGVIELVSHAAMEGNIVHSSIHTGSGRKEQDALSIDLDEFNEFTVEWTKDKIVVCVNDQVMNEHRDEGMGFQHWPFDEEMYLVLSLGVGGDWAGQHGIDEDLLPATLEISDIEFLRCPESEVEEKQQLSWKLVWSDEFEGDCLDETKWSYDVEGNDWGWGNNELQAYTIARPENCIVHDGCLRIVAMKEDYMCPVSDKEFHYTSARLVTRHKGDWLYGRIEVQARLPVGRGSWPAIWMLPSDWEYGGWPASGEIDIMEHVGWDRGRVHASAHTDAYNHTKNTQKTECVFLSDVGETHVYSLEWTPDEYKVFTDDIHIFTFNREHEGGWESWPFDKRFHLLLNVAVGGDWGGVKGIDDDALPFVMEIDSVKVYEREE